LSTPDATLSKIFPGCLLFGKPAIIMSFDWDGNDDAMRVQETRHGFRMNRCDWTEQELAARLRDCLNDAAMRSRLAVTSAHMRAGRAGVVMLIWRRE
jgi:UDP:flavonoid glycosyltransferase YjiC (YdhE family)